MVGTDSAHESGLRKFFVRLLPFLFLLYFIAFLDRANIGFAALSMNKELGLSATSFGLAGTATFVTYLVFEIPSNLLLVKFGARRWISRIMITWGIASMATALATTDISLYAIRALVGAAEAGFLPGVLLYLSYWIPTRQRGRAAALFMVAQPVAIGVGGLLSGVVMKNFAGALGISDWQWLFIMEGLPAVILGLLVLKVLPNHPDTAPWLEPEERRAIAAVIAVENQKVEAASSGQTKLSQFFSPSFICICLGYFTLVNGLNALSTWTPLIVKEMIGPKADVMNIGLLTAVPGLVAAIVMPLIGLSSDRRNERGWHYAISALVAAGGWLLIVFGGVSAVKLLGLVIATSGGYAAMVILWTTPNDILNPAARPIGIAALGCSGIFGSITSPFVIGMLRDMTGSFNASIWYASTLTALSALFIALSLKFAVRAKTAQAPVGELTPHEG